MFKNIYKTRIYLITAIALTVIAMAIIGANAYKGAKAEEERILISRAENILSSIDPRGIVFLSGNETDIDSPFYISFKNQLLKIRSVNKDIRFIYLAGKHSQSPAGEGDIFFYVDSELRNSPDYSPPGELYTEAGELFHETFKTGLPRFEGPLEDRWGKWVSAFIAVNHPNTGEQLAVLGVDIDAFEYKKRITLAVVAPVFFIALIFLVFFIGYIKYKKEEELLAFKTEFISIASHDIRSPLTGLSWMIQNLLKDEVIARYPKIKSNVALMDKTSRGILEIIRSILNFSRLESAQDARLEKAELNLRSIAMEIMEMLSLFAKKKNVTISFDNDWPEIVSIIADQVRIKRAISNVVANSIKYSPVDGVIRIGYKREKKWHILSIFNSGPKIPESARKKIFSKFFRAGDIKTTSMSGTGLGLYFAKQIIEEHQGDIWFDSQEGGTTFYIKLPVKNSNDR